MCSICELDLPQISLKFSFDMLSQCKLGLVRIKPSSMKIQTVLVFCIAQVKSINKNFKFLDIVELKLCSVLIFFYPDFG